MFDLNLYESLMGLAYFMEHMSDLRVSLGAVEKLQCHSTDKQPPPPLSHEQ